MNVVVNVSDAKTSGNTGDTIITYSLGSCIGVAVYDPEARVGGMLHYQLPTSTVDPERARQNPTMFADTGMKTLLDQMNGMGVNKKRLKVKIAGAAQMLADASMFDIGRRNHAAIRKVLWQHGLFLEKEDIGGKSPRTMTLNIGDGQVTIKSNGEVNTL